MFDPLNHIHINWGTANIPPVIYRETQRSSGWQHWYKLERWKLVFNVLCENKDCHPNDRSVSVYAKHSNRRLVGKVWYWSVMTSSTGHIFRVIGPLRGHRWIPLTKACDVEFDWCFLWYAWTNVWANNRDAGDLKRYRAYYDVTVMYFYPYCSG